MNSNSKLVFSRSKVSLNLDRVEAYARGEKIYPVTMELDLTQKCTRNCPGCPYGAARSPGLTPSLSFLDRLFSILGPHIPGLVLSGGEPTSTPHFPEVMALAKRRGFKEVAVITNGSLLHAPKVQDALLEHASSVRVSLYDWQLGESRYFLNTLNSIENLRKRVDLDKSQTQVAATMLTKTKWIGRIEPVGQAALAAGVHWLYFHPYCIDWDTPHPIQDSQQGVVAALDAFKNRNGHRGLIQIPYERFYTTPLKFDQLHAGHFLIQVGADGVNYAGPECKYEKDYALLDLNEHLEDDFLWRPERLAKLEQINSDNYRPIGTRHRPPVISDFIHAYLNGEAGEGSGRAGSYHQPNII